ncbi:MAG TPA: hypothetical protein PKD00_09235, partial [Burkholderiales bacterium]|nr:hypothetical protein [Burkholderiales bacterium]
MKIISLFKTRDLKPNKDNIINELFNKTNYIKALKYARININRINIHRSILFTNSMTNSLQCTLLHLANLKFGFIEHNDDELSNIFEELFHIAPNDNEIEQLFWIKNNRLKEYDSLINNILKNKKIITFANNNVFSGSIKDGLYAEGRIIESGYNFFEGVFINGRPHNGKIIFAYDDGSSYEGQWNKIYGKHGNGKYTYQSGSTYQGQWYGDKMHGNGKYTYKDGSTYQGQWNNDILTDIDEKFLSN